MSLRDDNHIISYCLLWTPWWHIVWQTDTIYKQISENFQLSLYDRIITNALELRLYCTNSLMNLCRCDYSSMPSATLAYIRCYNRPQITSTTVIIQRQPDEKRPIIQAHDFAYSLLNITWRCTSPLCCSRNVWHKTMNTGTPGHTDASTPCPIFCRHNFQVYFLKWFC